MSTGLIEGMQYFEVAISDVASTNPGKITGLIELLKSAPFTIYNMITEIDGQSVKDYIADSDTL
jgi:hypothetical protein